MRSKITLLMSGIALFAGLPAAQAQLYKVTLSPLNEIPPAASSATGSAVVSLNGVTHEMRVSATFAGLTGLSTASHIHCCVPQPGNASVATTTPAFVGFPIGVTSGSWDRIYNMRDATTWNAPFLAANGTPAGAETAFIAGVAANQSYLNIHSATFPGGEIRGFLVLQKFASNPNLSVRTTGVAGALDSLGAGTGAVSDALVALTALSPAQQAAALELLTPIASRGTLVAASSSLDTTFDQLSNHLDGLRSPVAPAVAQTDNGLWLMGHGINRHQKLEDGFAGYKGDGWGVVGGIDHAIAPGAFIGAAVSYSDSSLDYRDQLSGSSDDIKSTQVSLYGSQDTGQIYIEGMLAYAWQKYDGDRNTGVAGIATGDYNGHQWGARFGGGMPIALAPNASITPQAHLSWDEVKQDAFTETGGALALAVASRSADRFRSSIGAQVDFDAGMADIKTRLFVRGFWHHDFKNDGIVTTASFVAGGTSFVTPGQELDSDPFTVGAGINFYGQGSFSAALTYDLTLGNSYQSHVFEAKARVAF